MAEPVFQQVVKGQEKVLGQEHPDTLYSLYLHGRLLFALKKYEMAKLVFQQVVKGREKVLGKEHTDTQKAIGWITKCASKTKQEAAKCG